MASNTTDKPTYTFNHPELGSLTGIIQPDNVVQFRAIPYATIPARFKRSIPLDSLPDNKGQYTEHGYACPQVFPNREADGGPFPTDPVKNASSEFSCLILQLNIPLTVLQSLSTASASSTNKIPVLVYIHGGGFELGKIDEQHTTALLASQGVETGNPIIAASIQYRLGALGYLHSSRADANNGLWDQRNALIWIQRFVSGFGGDEGRVTVFGESAGSMSICYQMLSEPPETGPLFQRVVLMSGIIGPATAPCGWEEAERRCEAFYARLGIEETGEEALKRVREVDIDDIVAASAQLGDEGGLWLCVRDKQWFGPAAESLTWDRIPVLMGQCEWVTDVVLGCTSFEGTTFSSRYSDVIPAAFLASLTAQLGAQSALTIANAYAMTPTMDKNLFLTSLLRWLGDAIFDAPMHMLASHLSTQTTKNVYRYIFNLRNPFPNNALYQQPHHWVDIYFVFKAHQFRFPSQRLKDLSTKHAQLWIEFASGKAPWGKYVYSGTGGEAIMFSDEREGWAEKRSGEVEEVLEWGYGRCEELVKSWEGARGRAWAPLELECLRGMKKT